MSRAANKLIKAAAGAAGEADTGDDDFANVVLLLDGDGTSGDDNETFTDSSTNGYTIIENGSVVQGSFSPYGDNWSNYFDGSSYLSVPDSTDFDFGTGDFTWEAWIRTTVNVNYQSIVGSYSSGSATWGVHTNSSGTITYFVAGSTIFSGSTTVTDGAWHHIAIARSGTSLRLFVDGVQDGSTQTNSTNIANSAEVRIGSLSSSLTRYFTGYISNVRIIKGTALYTSAFTPSTSPLTAVTNTQLLISQSNRFVDNSSSSRTVTVGGTPKVTPFSPFKDDDARDITTDGGSAYFDGDSGNYLSTASTITIGTNPFTLELWANVADLSSIHSLISLDGGSLNRFFLGYLSGQWVFRKASTQDITFSGPSTNEWSHIAVVREGTGTNQTKIYVNGVLAGTGTCSVDYPADEIQVATARTTGSGPLTGYISDVRLVIGTAIYTSAFTPPTSPLTAVTNTELLLNFQDAGIYDLSGINNIDTVGNAQIDTAVKKYGTGSMEFDGTGDYLQTIAGTEELYFTGQDFTVEGWVYLNNLSSNHTCFYYGDTNRSTSNASGIAFDVFYRSSDGYFRANQYYASTGGFGGSNTLVTPAATQWYHVAYYRIGSQFYLAVDGNVANIGNFTQDLQNASDWVFRVGKESDSIGNDMDGFLDDVRVTMGKARYGTSNFTPPDAALPKF